MARHHEFFNMPGTVWQRLHSGWHCQPLHRHPLSCRSPLGHRIVARLTTRGGSGAGVRISQVSLGMAQLS